MNLRDVENIDWPQAWGEPCARGMLRQSPEDFEVQELLSFEPSGSGEHVLLQIRKRGENTLWVARQLARLAGVKPREVGYAGLKDRHAVTTQWFSVGLAGNAAPDWESINSESITLLRAERHHRKLRTGALMGNRFHLRVTQCTGDSQSTAERMATIAQSGIPNYFGEQRFGREGDNVAQARALFAGRIKVRDRKLRGLLLSAARSWLFNELLARRVREGSWNQLIPGEVLGLDGRSAVFASEGESDDELSRRLKRLEIHPTGPLWGTGNTMVAADAKTLEESVAAEYPALAEGLERAGLKHERRPLRTRVQDLSWDFASDALELGFTLRSGSYATAVLREIVHYDSPNR